LYAQIKVHVSKGAVGTKYIPRNWQPLRLPAKMPSAAGFSDASILIAAAETGQNCQPRCTVFSLTRGMKQLFYMGLIWLRYGINAYVRLFLYKNM
jgi:hypothetical protein